MSQQQQFMADQQKPQDNAAIQSSLQLEALIEEDQRSQATAEQAQAALGRNGDPEANDGI